MATDMFQPGSSSIIPATLVELSVSCRKLIDADVFSKSDPMCVLFTQDPGSKKWAEFGRTEIIWNNLNPDFVKKFIIHYFFEESQKLKFEIYDVDSKSAKLDKHDFLGKLECTLAEIVIANRLVKKLHCSVGWGRKRYGEVETGSGTIAIDQNTIKLFWQASDEEFGELGKKQEGGPKRDSGVIIVNSEELSSCKEEATMQFSAHQLDKKDFFGKSDPFLTFYRCNEDGSFTVVHRTEVIKRTLNPTWRTFTINIRLLCNGDYERPIKVECYDWDADGGHDLIGIFQTTLRELSKGREISNVYECINPKKQAKKKKYRNSGTIELLSCSVDKVFTFLDYIRGGTQIHCTFAIDFTASNGNPTSPSSLHYISPYNLNPYATALNAVGHIIQDYDTDQLFPALGFGARLPPDGVVSHEFALNGNPENPYCHGVQGVVEAYHKTLHSVQLYGPTNFSPCINHVARFAALRPNGNDYFILLILTDGIITDMPQTMEAVVNASKLPMSIIIIGIGDADFEAMEILDGDDVRVSSRGRYAERDIVQFVPMRNFMFANQGDNSLTLQARLAKEVLEEIPEQFLSYMKKHNVQPKPPLLRQQTISSITSLPASEQ